MLPAVDPHGVLVGEALHLVAQGVGTRSIKQPLEDEQEAQGHQEEEQQQEQDRGGNGNSPAGKMCVMPMDAGGSPAGWWPLQGGGGDGGGVDSNAATHNLEVASEQRTSMLATGWPIFTEQVGAALAARRRGVPLFCVDPPPLQMQAVAARARTLESLELCHVQIVAMEEGQHMMRTATMQFMGTTEAREIEQGARAASAAALQALQRLRQLTTTREGQALLLSGILDGGDGDGDGGGGVAQAEAEAAQPLAAASGWCRPHQQRLLRLVDRERAAQDRTKSSGVHEAAFTLLIALPADLRGAIDGSSSPDGGSSDNGCSGGSGNHVGPAAPKTGAAGLEGFMRLPPQPRRLVRLFERVAQEALFQQARMTAAALAHCEERKKASRRKRTIRAAVAGGKVGGEGLYAPYRRASVVPTHEMLAFMSQHLARLLGMSEGPAERFREYASREKACSAEHYVAVRSRDAHMAAITLRHARAVLLGRSSGARDASGKGRRFKVLLVVGQAHVPGIRADLARGTPSPFAGGTGGW